MVDIDAILNHARTRLGDSKADEFLSTGYPPLDVELGGGYRRGTFSEILGDDSCGKSILALSAAREDGLTLYVSGDATLPFGTTGILGDKEDFVVLETTDPYKVLQSIERLIPLGLSLVVLDPLNVFYSDRTSFVDFMEKLFKIGNENICFLIVTQLRVVHNSGIEGSPYPEQVIRRFASRIRLKPFNYKTHVALSEYMVLSNRATPRTQRLWKRIAFLNFPEPDQLAGADNIHGLREVAHRYDVPLTESDLDSRCYRETYTRVMKNVR